MIYHITETKLEQTMASYYNNRAQIKIIQHRMMRAQMIIKETENNNKNISHKASQEDVALHTPPLK